jgi:transcription antitermination factor NusG
MQMVAREKPGSVGCIAQAALESLRRKIGGEIRDGHLFPLAPVLSELVERSDEEIVPDQNRRWHVIHTEPQCEHMAHGGLVGRRFKVYLPTITKVVRAGRRERPVERPMFPGYLFIRFDWTPRLDGLTQDRWTRVFATAGVHGLLMNGERPAVVPDAAIAKVYAIEEDIRTPKTKEQAIGYELLETVRISDGPFAEHLGKIDQLDDEKRITVLLSLFGRQTKVVLSAGQIEKV